MLRAAVSLLVLGAALSTACVVSDAYRDVERLDGSGGSGTGGEAGSDAAGGAGGAAGGSAGTAGGLAGTGGSSGTSGSAGADGSGGNTAGGGAGGGGGTGGADPCAGVTCTSPPPSVCASPGALTLFEGTGTCDATGACKYASHDEPCPAGCGAGACLGDPCIGVTCDAPPPNTCANVTTLSVYGAQGTCSGGTCSYVSTPMACAGGCSGGVCAGNPCLGVNCNAPPASSCADANSLRTFAVPGNCAAGTCSYTPSIQPCSFGCVAGACVGDPCAAVSCTTPPAVTCAPGPAVRTYSSPGTCSGGACSYGYVDAPCSSSNGMPACSSGSCTIACNSGYADCDGTGANGCEQQTSTSISHCGSCNNACAAINGVPACTGGSCAISCDVGYANCDGVLANGCEANLTTPASCGTCGNACNGTNGTATCSGGVCGIACSAGFGNCDAMAANGCEASLTVTQNCGACGNACSTNHANPACAGGACTLACSSGWANCDGNVANGCETSLDSTSNCGACYVGCTTPPPPTCVEGATLRTYSGPTTCSGGVCSYGQLDSVCASGTCSAGACTPSCAVGGPGLTDCGPAADESCCASLPLAGGAFYRSYDGVSSGYTSQAYPAIVSDLRMDKYEVTVGRFRRFKAAWEGGWRPATAAGRHAHLNGGRGLSVPGGGAYEAGWDTAWASSVAPSDTNLACDSFPTWTSGSGSSERRPVNCVNWYEAAAFCIWDAGFLPSEAEWNYAAAGGTEQRVYPWSSPATSTLIDCSRASYDCANNACGDGTAGCALTDLLFVGTRPQGNGRYGQADLSGNVWEWVLDWYQTPYDAGTCNDCAQSSGSAFRVSRGGDFFGNNPSYVLSSYRDVPSPSSRDDARGARCARPLPTPPSCTGSGPGLTDCGPAANESCCTSLPVKGGSFYRSYDGVSSGFTSQAFPATVSDFKLDKYEITVGRFRKFKAAWDDGWRPAAGAGKHAHLNGGQGLTAPGGGSYEAGWDTAWESNAAPTGANLSCGAPFETWTISPGANERRPVNCVGWYPVAAFCIWDGGFLPSEAEWNYAAAGGAEQRVYPWSSPATSTAIDCTRASYACSTTACGDGLSGCTRADLVFAGSIPGGNGRYGHADLAGNVFEWVLDGDPGSYAVAACSDCAVTSTPTARVLRGGSIFNDASSLVTSYRTSSAPTFRDYSLGSRCARAP